MNLIEGRRGRGAQLVVKMSYDATLDVAMHRELETLSLSRGSGPLLLCRTPPSVYGGQPVPARENCDFDVTPRICMDGR